MNTFHVYSKLKILFNRIILFELSISIGQNSMLRALLLQICKSKKVWCVMSKCLKLNNNKNQWMTVYPQRDSKIQNKSSFAEWMVGLASQRVFVSYELKTNDNNLRLLFYLQKKFFIWFMWLFCHTICDWKAFFFCLYIFFIRGSHIPLHYSLFQASTWNFKWYDIKIEFPKNDFLCALWPALLAVCLNHCLEVFLCKKILSCEIERSDYCKTYWKPNKKDKWNRGQTDSFYNNFIFFLSRFWHSMFWKSSHVEIC